MRNPSGSFNGGQGGKDAGYLLCDPLLLSPTGDRTWRIVAEREGFVGTWWVRQNRRRCLFLDELVSPNGRLERDDARSVL